MRRLEETYRDRIDFHILNVDQRSTNELAARFRVRGIPTIVLLDARGNAVTTLVGYQSEDDLVAAVEQLLAATP